jgi:hypothetical protein
MNIVANAEGLFFQHKGMEMELKSNLKAAIIMYKLVCVRASHHRESILSPRQVFLTFFGCHS